MDGTRNEVQMMDCKRCSFMAGKAPCVRCLAAARAEIERLRAALKRIVAADRLPPWDTIDIGKIARNALDAKEEQQ